MAGGAGNDTYYVDSCFDSVVENTNGGTDTVFASASFALLSNVENITLTGAADIAAYGNGLANVLTGNSGNNLLDGGSDADFMYGLAGNDGYMVNSSFDQIFENAGEGEFDTVYASVSYALGANIENLFLQGTGNFQAIGNAQSNTITGNDGDNLMDGGGGIDGLIGGKGNDGYVIDNSFDQIVEYANEGTDAVYADVSYQLGENLETLFLSGDAIQGYGNSGVNSIVGTAGNNGIDGRGGADVLTGNGGIDTFVFNVGEMNGDTIMDFDGLGAGAGDQLMFVGFGAGATLQQISANVWQVDYNGGVSHEQFTLANGASLHASDFVFL
jgi:Ca2+-binding RTX toxin-like protein